MTFTLCEETDGPDGGLFEYHPTRSAPVAEAYHKLALSVQSVLSVLSVVKKHESK